MDAAGQFGDRRDRGRLVLHETAIAVVAVTRHDDADRQVRDPQGRLRPIERIAVVVEGHVAVLDEVPGEEHRGIGDADDDVVIGVPTSKVAELDAAIAEIQERRLRECPVRRIDDDLGKVGGDLRHLRGDPSPADVAGPFEERPAADMAPDRRRPEDVVAEGVVEMAVGVDDDVHRRRGQRPQVVGDLARLDVGRPRVDQQDVVAPEHDPDVLVVELVATHEHPIADLESIESWRHGMCRARHVALPEPTIRSRPPPARVAAAKPSRTHTRTRSPSLSGRTSSGNSTANGGPKSRSAHRHDTCSGRSR